MGSNSLLSTLFSNSRCPFLTVLYLAICDTHFCLSVEYPVGGGLLHGFLDERLYGMVGERVGVRLMSGSGNMGGM
jgi:hypothetical protein